ncbi:MAG: OmpA family protein [Muribaculaceae bacterium]|nr:OmpA family protein [Muribaculaceae bacterium]MBR3100639.1 OmpA family protein [Muribaculaceae bacterium]
MKKTMCLLLSALMILGISSCNMSNTAKGGLLGGGGGAAIGAGIGALIGKGKGAAIGAAIGAVAGGTAGALIGRKMDKQAKELAQIAGAQVDTVTDVNNLTAIKVTFDSGILFDFNKSNLSASAKKSLTQFATSLQNNPQTNVQIYGHTDNIGTRAANEKVSTQRAEEVRKYLVNSGVSNSRLTSEGLAYDYPVASNDSEAGRAQNRRVEIYISANDDMIQAAQNGTLQ